MNDSCSIVKWSTGKFCTPVSKLLFATSHQTTGSPVFNYLLYLQDRVFSHLSANLFALEYFCFYRTNC